jgi:hypothetical protein
MLWMLPKFFKNQCDGVVFRNDLNISFRILQKQLNHIGFQKRSQHWLSHMWKSMMRVFFPNCVEINGIKLLLPRQSQCKSPQIAWRLSMFWLFYEYVTKCCVIAQVTLRIMVNRIVMIFLRSMINRYEIFDNYMNQSTLTDLKLRVNRTYVKYEYLNVVLLWNYDYCSWNLL